MENHKKNLTIDPDYQSYKSALELNEEEEKNTKLKKIRKIIEEEYDKEIANKLEQTKQITLQICKVRKLLDLVRNVSIKQYYNKKELEYNDEEITNPDLIIAPDKQNRIHPAVKKLLGNNAQNLECLYMSTKRKRNNTTNSRNYNLNNKEKLDDSNNSSPKTKISKLDDEIPIHTTRTTTPIVEQQLNNQNNIKIEPTEIPLDTIKKRNKTKRRIVIGNLSKSISTSEDSKLTRKWMVYVQGPKHKENVSDFIEKVIFYLHSSYKPYDVVEVRRHPIHLQRPGWGEFKIKLEIFFKNKLNKPVILEHDLKFKDHLFNGRETLGSETIVDLFLYEDIDSFDDVSIKNEPIKLEDLVSTSYEHNYCHGDDSNDVKIKTENDLDLTNSFSMDHDYSLPPSQQNSPKIQEIKNEINQNCDNNNDLIYGLNQSYLDPPIKDCQVNSLQTEKILIPLNELNDFLQVHQKDIQFNNNKTKIIIFGKRIDNNNIMKITNNIYNDNRISFKINLFNHKFKNVGETLPYLFKRLPLITDLAKNTNYKRLFPFTAKTLDEYHSWNVGKRRNAEWSLARTIRNLLRHNKIYDSEKWSTKTILMYGRSHCYIPSNNYNLFHRDSEEKRLLLSCLSNSNPSVHMKFLNNSRTKTEADIDVDVDSNTDIKESSIKRNSNCIDISDPQLRHQCSFIRETALDCNIVLKNEELYDGIVMNCAERMILEAVKCLADSLIRRAHNYKVCHMDFGCKGDYVSLDDVQAVIDERPEMIAITRFKNKRRVLEKYF